MKNKKENKKKKKKRNEEGKRRHGSNRWFRSDPPLLPATRSALTLAEPPPLGAVSAGAEGRLGAGLCHHEDLLAPVASKLIHTYTVRPGGQPLWRKSFVQSFLTV